MMTSGLPTASSYPSRRIVSIRTERWSSPRPETMNESRSSVGSTRRATFDCSSRSSRSLRCRDVRNWPSPVSGESLTVNSMLRVGSSTSIRGRATGRLGVGDRVADVDRAEADDGHDVARLGLLDFGPAELVEDQHVVDRARDA